MKDTSSLESHLKVFFYCAPNYARTKLKYFRKVTQEVYEESLSLAKDDYFAAEVKENEHANEVETLEAEILQVVNQQGVLKKQLEELQRNEESINSSRHGAKGVLINFRKEVATKKEKILMLENTPYSFEAEFKLWRRWRHFLRSQNGI
ncbi:UNVERIFIED_CONTAM: hypothetical protein Sangu_0840500 [Sesamum angustifolium]|uniref:Uncharacterized protein n=1 Tax=Sesamum angustifolium TaxID=2727405 RepID=A0AAW2PWN5_9LAMI